jgi:Putative zinc-finger
MTGCERQQSGDIELYFYDELEPRQRSGVESHLRSCAECRLVFDELSTIRSALGARPLVDAPPGGNWTGFMRRLDEAVQFDRHINQHGDETVREATWPPPRVESIGRARLRAAYAPYLATAAILTLVTSALVHVTRSTQTAAPVPASEASPPAPSISAIVPAVSERSTDAAFAALSEQHFERSKLVVLGLANKDPHDVHESDWAYERGLATNLLSDTRLYRMAAEDRGLKTLAGVMGDLELVLLQTSLADAPDAGVLEQIQRLIHKRDLVSKMDATATTTGS